MIAEAAYLLDREIGSDAEAALYTSIIDRDLLVENLDAHDWVRIRELAATHADLDFGFVDASVITVAERLRIDTIFTIDRRHFHVVRPDDVGVASEQLNPTDILEVPPEAPGGAFECPAGTTDVLAASWSLTGPIIPAWLGISMSRTGEIYMSVVNGFDDVSDGGLVVLVELADDFEGGLAGAGSVASDLGEVDAGGFGGGGVGELYSFSPLRLGPAGVQALCSVQVFTQSASNYLGDWNSVSVGTIDGLGLQRGFYSEGLADLAIRTQWWSARPATPSV